VYNPGVLAPVELKAVAALYNRRRINPEPMITHRIPPEPEAYLETIRAIERGEVVKALIEWES